MQEPASDRRPGGGRRRLLVGLGATVGVLALGGLAVLTLPIPPLDGYLAGQVRSRAAALLTCPGSTPPTVDVDGPMVPQLVSGRLQELRLTVPDVALLGGGTRSTVAVTLHGVTGLQSATPTAERLNTRATLAYQDLPAPALDPNATLTPTGDGRIAVDLTAPKAFTDTVPVVVTLDLSLADRSVVATPRSVSILGADVPLGANGSGSGSGSSTGTADGGALATLVGGPRSFPLPAAPSGLRFTTVRAETDGIHVGLEGSVTTPLSALPRSVNGNAVSYRVRDGLLGISTTQSVFGFFEIPVTIWTAPTISGGRLVLQPRTVEALGDNRSASDPVAAAALSLVDRASLSRALPELPKGVAYASASVSAAGLVVGVSGSAVTPFSALPAPDGVTGATYGAANGALTVRTTGLPAGAAPTKVRLVVAPRLDGTTLHLDPKTMSLLGKDFDAAPLLAGLGSAADLTFPLPALAGGLRYGDLTAAADGLQVTVTGTKVSLSRDLLGAADCSRT